MPTAQLAVTIAALVAGTICFLLYVYATIAGIRARSAALPAGAPASAGEGSIQPLTVSVEDVSRLIEALGRLADSLSRASPALMSLVGALAFFAIAALSSGALHG